MTLFETNSRCFALLAFIFGAPAVFAQSPRSPAPDDEIIRDSHHVEVYVSDQAMQAQYIRDAQFIENRPATLSGGLFFTEQRDIVGTASVLTRVADPARYPRWNFEVGGVGYGALLNAENQDVFSLGLGGNAKYDFGSPGGLGIAFGAFYSPDILTFGEADNVSDVFVRVETVVRSGLVAFAGYRRLAFSLPDNSNRELDDHAHIGIRWTF